MFNLDQHEATLKYTPRIEKHGIENAPACTLNILMSGSNSLLDLIDPELKAIMFKPVPKEHQDLADQATDTPHLCLLRFPNLNKGKKKKQFEWSYESAGYRVVIGGGLSVDLDLIFVQCKIGSFAFTCHDGGTVDITFNIDCDPSTEEAGRLYELNGQEVSLTLDPPSAEQQAQMELDEQDDGHDYGHVPQGDTDTGFADDAEKALQEAFAEDDAA